MNYAEFRVLLLRMRDPNIRQRRLADECQMSLGSVNSALKSLSDKGLLDETGAVTDAGIAALEPYKVDNAVIMAAGCER